MSSISKAMREARMNASYDEDQVVSDRVYNAVMGGVVLYGILLNVVLCKYVGNVYQYINPILFFVLYFVAAIGGVMICKYSSNPFVSFFGYNLVVVPFGLVISTAVEAYGGLESSVVTWAFIYTLAITGVMVLGAILFPDFFASVGRFLGIALIGVILASVIAIFVSGMTYVVALFSAIVFSLYIGFDFWRSQQFPKTIDNAVDCALDIYVDIANLFLDLLRILGKDRD